MCVCVCVYVCVHVTTVDGIPSEFSNDNSGGAYADQTVSTVTGLE